MAKPVTTNRAEIREDVSKTKQPKRKAQMNLLKSLKNRIKRIARNESHSRCMRRNRYK